MQSFNVGCFKKQVSHISLLPSRPLWVVLLYLDSSIRRSIFVPWCIFDSQETASVQSFGVNSLLRSAVAQQKRSWTKNEES